MFRALCPQNGGNFRAKTTGCFRKSRYRGVERTHAQGQYVVAAANLVRMAKPMLGSPPRPKRA
jgi:hypothetical protein